MVSTQTPVPAPVTVDTTGAQIIDNEASSSDQRDGRDIYLPNHVESVSHIAVDIGGSLAKVVYFTRSPVKGPQKSQQDEAASTAKAAGQSDGPLGTHGWAAHSRQSSAHGRGGSSTPKSDGPRPLPNHALESPRPSGTLTPTAILTQHPMASAAAIRSTFLKRRSLPGALPGGRLNFTKFETGDIESCIEFLSELITASAKANDVSLPEMRKGVKLMLTGGGAHLFYEVFEKELGVEVHREDEMGCLITGLNFITLIPDEVFWYSDELVSYLHSPIPPLSNGKGKGREADHFDGLIESWENGRRREDTLSSDSSSGSSRTSMEPPAILAPSADQQPKTTLRPDELPRPSPDPPLYAPVYESHPSPKLPCLLVNIGSGVSIIKVDDYGKFERVSGTSLGGGTLWGLLSLLTDAESFDEMLEMSSKGDNSSVDMLVSDIYGSVDALSHLGLKSTTIASSFGKVFRKDGPRDKEGRRKKFRQEDICKSLLYAVSNNIGQIAYMNAEKFNLDRIYFGGCFIRGHQVTISTLSYAIRFWSKGTKRAFFLRHEGYLGAIGAWIRHLGEQPWTPTSAGPTSGASATPVNGHSSPPVADLAAASTAAASSPLPAGVSALAAGRGASARHEDMPTPVAEVSEPSFGPSPARGATPVSMRETAASTSPVNPLLAEALALSTKFPNQERCATSQLKDESTETGPELLGGGGRDATQQRKEEQTQTQPQPQPQPQPAVAATRGAPPPQSDLAFLVSQLSTEDRQILAPVLSHGRAVANGVSNSNGEEPSSLTAEEVLGLGDLDAIDPTDEASVAELLAKLDMADGAADGLEAKLDALLGRLDGLLGAVEEEGGETGEERV